MWVPAGQGKAGQEEQGPVTADDLLKAAREHDYKVSRRLITDWVSVGLLDHPTARGRGRGKGKQYMFGRPQLGLFLQLLAKRNEGASRLALLNMPVVVWLVWGEQYVPLYQARKALTTWAERNRLSSAAAVDRSAKTTIGHIGHPAASAQARENLARALERLAYGQQFDRDNVLGAIVGVFDPAGTGLSRGPDGALTPEQLADVLEGRLIAADALVGGRVDDGLFARARQDYLLKGPLSPFLTELSVPGLSISPAARAAVEHAANNACLHLITLLGLILLHRQRGTQEAA